MQSFEKEHSLSEAVDNLSDCIAAGCKRRTKDLI